jgi:hypothetical protein
MKNFASTVAICVGLLVIVITLFADVNRIGCCFADACNYAVIVADPNPCRLDIISQRCSTTHPCADGFAEIPATNQSCGTYTIFGKDVDLFQPNPSGGNKMSVSVPDIECGSKISCVVNQYSEYSTCVNGVPTPTSGCTKHAADCCDGPSNTVTGFFVNQAGEDECGG